MKRIGDILTRHKTRVSVEDNVIYKQVTIRTKHKGVVLRGTQSGASIGTKQQWRVSAGQFILSRIDARNGAFGIIPEELEGAIVTNDFLSFDINENEVEREFFNVFLQSPIFLSACIKASRGNTNRKRVDEEFFLNFEVNLPPLAEQHKLIKRINKGRLAVGIAQKEITHQLSVLNKLKQAILQEAIEGKLTNEWRASHLDLEPASHLLQRIKIEKARLVATKKLRKEKALPRITLGEIPFEIPKGWEWCRLGKLIDKTESGWSPSCLKHPAANNRWGVLKTTAVQIGQYTADENKELPGSLSPRPEHEVLVGDILMTRAGPANRVGICALVRETRPRLMISDKIVRFRPLVISGAYLELFANTPLFQKLIEANKQGMAQSQVNISQENLKTTLIPLPPHAEQIEIVERVEALLSTYRALQSEIEHSRTHAENLFQAVLNQAFGTASINPPPQFKGAETRPPFNSPRKPARTQTAPMNPIHCSLKSFILRSFKMSSGYRSLRNPHCNFHENIEIPKEAAPICLVGLNGSGKSNLIEAIADVFCFLELINLPWENIISPSSKYRKNNHEFELLYTITDADGTRQIFVQKKKKIGADFYEVAENGSKIQIKDRNERLRALPRRIVGYSSGLNETVSHTFLRTRTLYSQEVRDAAPANNAESREVFDTRTLYMDYENNAGILLCNYIFRDPTDLEFIKRFTRVAGVSSFELRFNRKIAGKPGTSSIARITDELASFVEKFSRCAGQKYKKEQLEYQFSYKLDKKTKKLFVKEFKTAENLFLAMYKWSLLNALVLSDDERKAFLKDDITKGTLERPPVVPPKRRIFDVADMKVRLSKPNIIIDYSGLSDGEHQFVQVFGTVLLFNEPGTLFLFDEPESHFNPQWRTQFNSILNSTPNAATHEYVISTHSPYIVSGSRAENVYKFERTGATVTFKPVDFETYGASFDQLLNKLFSIKSLIDNGAREELESILKSQDLNKMEAAVGDFAESDEKRRLYESILRAREKA